MLNTWDICQRGKQENLDQVKDVVLRNRGKSIHEVVYELGKLFGSVQYILKGSLKMCQTITKLLPCLLSERQENLVKMCQDLQMILESDTIHSKDNHRCWDWGV
jgi:Zn finger protein HypA/HybF involved in hydrogenase expression